MAARVGFLRTPAAIAVVVVATLWCAPLVDSQAAKQSRPAQIAEALRNLRDPNPYVCAGAIDELRLLNAVDNARDVAPFLNSSETMIRKAAVVAIGALGAKQYAPEILRALRDESFGERSFAAYALGNLGMRAYADEISRFLTDRDYVVRSAVADVLAQLGAKECGPAITNLLMDEVSDVRTSATRALQTLGFEPSASDVYKIASKAVVMIETEFANGGMSGSGALVSADGRILTNRHVIQAGPEDDFGALLRITVHLHDGRSFAVATTRKHPAYDLALLQIANPPRKTPYLYFKDGLPLVGDDLIIIGHPAGLGWSLSQGKVSQIRDDDDGGKAVWIQTDGAVNPGNSGGPMLNRYGQIVGVATQSIVSLGGQPVSGLNFGISGPVARRFVFGY